MSPFTGRVYGKKVEYLTYASGLESEEKTENFIGFDGFYGSMLVSQSDAAKGASVYFVRPIEYGAT
jgi:hypothetical protein